MLYEADLEDAVRLCFRCAEVFEAELTEGALRCPHCEFEVTERRYRDFYRYAFYVTRYGVQYRQFYERPEPPQFKPFLTPLGDIATFAVLAAITGVLGNASYDVVKGAMLKILAQRQKSEKGDRLQLGPDEVDKLIQFVTDYENGFEGLPEAIRDEITEEILGDLAAENQVIGMKLMKCVADPTPANKRLAKVLSRDLARRRVRQSRKPSAPSWKFWDKV